MVETIVVIGICAIKWLGVGILGIFALYIVARVMTLGVLASKREYDKTDKP